MKATRSAAPGCLTYGLGVLFCLLTLLLLPIYPCPEFCCNIPRKSQWLLAHAGVTPQEAQRMIDWADQFPCCTSGMRKRVTYPQTVVPACR